MEYARGYRAKEHGKMKHVQNDGIGLNSDTLVVIKLPDSRVLRIVSRSVLLAVVILTLPCICTILREIEGSSYYNLSADEFVSDLMDDVDVEFLDSLFLDLANEGLVKKGDKALFMCSSIGPVIDNTRFLNSIDIDLVLGSDLGHEGLLQDASFDFIFGFGFENIGILDRMVKVGGIVVTQLGDLPSALQKQSNYKVVYLRRYSSTVVALRKTSMSNEFADSSSKRRLCELEMEAKKTALNGLEDVLLEPPRRLLAESKKDLKKFKFLPDLLGVPLEDYRRRVFIDVSLQEEKDRVTKWFTENYPTRKQNFEIYNIEMVPEEVSKTVVPSVEISDWLEKNVKEDEFVVMKADAEVVEEMIRRRSIDLVDELFLECQNQWQNGDGNESKRAYWECLALYGRLRDKGVAVHQWWS